MCFFEFKKKSLKFELELFQKKRYMSIKMCSEEAIMGIFDFIKNIGKKAENELDMAASLKASLEAVNLGIENLMVSFHHGEAVLYGQVKSLKDKEIARLIVGNHKGVERVNDDGITLSADSVEKDTKKPESIMYTVQSGDSLGKIAKAYLGDANRYKEIFVANQPMLKDPNLIYPGQVIRIPQDLKAHA